MQHAEHLTPTQMQQFLEAGATLSFAGTGRKPVYALIERTLRGCQYPALSKKDKGIVRRYLAKISGLSRSQITRLIARWRERGVLEPRASRRRRFPRRYTPDDITLLARVDAAHEGLSAPAIRRILERECKVYGKTAYQRLAAISPSHIYNLRRTRAYREHHVHHTKTRAAAVSIGERRKPDPGGRPGYLRVDTVHQGDTDSGKGLYHINAVDTVTQWEVVGWRNQGPFAAGFRGPAASVSLSRPRLSLRQRLGVSQLSGGPVVGENEGRGVSHQIATLIAAPTTRAGAVVRKHIGHELAPKSCWRPISIRLTVLVGLRRWRRPNGAPASLPARRLPHAPFARRAGELFETGDHGDVSGATSGADERYRVCFADAAPQERTARRVPLATLSEGWESRARSRTGRSGIRQGGRGQGKLVLLKSPDQACAQLPPPPNPPPHPKHRHHHHLSAFFSPTSGSLRSARRASVHAL